MNCREYQENIADYVAGRLAPTEALQLTAHLADCPTCAEEERQERAFSARFADAPQIIAPADLWMRLTPQLTPQPRFFWPRFAFPRLVIATPALAAAAVIALFWFQSHPTSTVINKPVITDQRPAPLPSSMTTLVNDVREIGVSESEMLLEETHAARQMGLAAAPEGGSL